MSEELKKVLERGRARFVDNHPTLQQRLDELNQNTASAVGADLEDVYQAEIDRYITAVAKERGEDALEMIIGLGATSSEDADMLKAQRRARIMGMIGA